MKAIASSCGMRTSRVLLVEEELVNWIKKLQGLPKFLETRNCTFNNVELSWSNVQQRHPAVCGLLCLVPPLLFSHENGSNRNGNPNIEFCYTKNCTRVCYSGRTSEPQRIYLRY